MSGVFFEWLFVNILFVEERARRKGIGSLLLAEGEAHGKKLGARRARLDNFRVAGAQVLSGYSISLMVKELK